MAYFVITSLTAAAGRGQLFIDADEVSMISSRPTCPDAKNLSAGAEFSLNNDGIIFSKWYNPINLEPARRVSLCDEGRGGII